MGKKEKLYFIDGDEVCRPLSDILEQIQDEEIDEITVQLAEKEKHPDVFWCKRYNEAYPIGCKDCCGKVCKHYEPRNGKNGICKNYGYIYIGTKEFTLNINGELKEIKEETK